MKRILALALGLACLAGCRYTVNLITERRSFDRYKDMIAQAKDELTRKTAFYNEAMGQCQQRGAEPYPQLGADLQGMSQSIAAMNQDQGRIEKFKLKYDSFAADRAQINSDDAADWARFKDLQSEFNALSQPMNEDLARYRQLAQAFTASCGQFQVAKLNGVDVQNEVGNFMGNMRDALGNVDKRLDEDRKVLEFARSSGVDRGLLHRKEEIFKKMKEMGPQFDDLRDGANDSADDVDTALKGRTTAWTGPGMPGDLGTALGDFRSAKDDFWKNKKYFDDLARSFDEAKAEPQAAAPQAPPANH